MGRLLTVVLPDGTEHDLLLEADEDAPLTLVADRIARHLAIPPGTGLRGEDGSPLPGDLPLADSPLRDGCRIRLGGAPGGPPRARPRRIGEAEAAAFRESCLIQERGGRQVFNGPPRHPREPAGPEGGGTGPALLSPLHRGLDVGHFMTGPPDGLDHLGTVLRETHPGPERLLAQTLRKGRRLWQRRREDADFLWLRLGTGRVAAGTGDGPGTDRFPVLVDLRRCAVLGITGAPAAADALAAWLVAQTALLHPPSEAVIRLLGGWRDEPRWSFARFLPAARAAHRGLPQVTFGADGAAEQLAELETLIGERLRQDRGDRPGPGPELVVVLRHEPGGEAPAGLLPRLLREGPPAGVRFVLVGAGPLPEECRTVVTLDGTGMTFRTGTRAAPPWLAASPDGAGQDWLDETARALAPLRDHGLPLPGPLVGTRADLLDLYGADGFDGHRIAREWRRPPGWAPAPVATMAGRPVELDLLGKGRHALVAGAPWSGKTTLLRTWVTALARAYSPERLNVLLIDYKGGPAFRELAALPHSVGLVTDLDDYLADRGLRALGAELRRRERLLGEAGVWDIAARPPALPPLPRLVVVVDEFAGLAAEHPGFVAGLAGIMRRGPALGMHLALATRRPAALPDAVRDLAGLRIALRVAEPGDGVAAVGLAEAASLPAAQPGLAYVRTGAEPPRVVRFAVPVARPLPRERPGAVVTSVSAPPRAPAAAGGAVPDAAADIRLRRLVGELGRAWRLTGGPRPVSPWLPPLPDLVTLESLPDTGGAPEVSGVLPVPFGLEDAPEEQAMRPLTLRLGADAGLVVAGDLGSGRSHLLRTLAAAVARRYRSSEVHLYGVDGSRGGLRGLAALPHCGAVVTTHQREPLARLARRLVGTVRERQERLARGRWGEVVLYNQDATPRRRMPQVLLLIDDWGEIAALGGPVAHDLRTVLREGPRVGICPVLTGDPTVLDDPALRTAGTRTLLLRLDNRKRYAGEKLSPRLLPLDMVPGRGVLPESGRAVQIAVLSGAPSSSGQGDALAGLAAAARERDREVPAALRPFSVDAPELSRFHVGGGTGRPVGREDVLAWLRDRHVTGTPVALLGPRRAGKTWVLGELWQRLREDGEAEIHRITVPHPQGGVDTPDELARLLDREVRGAAYPAEALLDKAGRRTGSARPAYLLDEAGRLRHYHPAAVSWLRDLGQHGAWVLYTGTEKDWQTVSRWALTWPGSSFGNDVATRPLGPLNHRDALDFLTVTAANLGVDLAPDGVAAAILDLVGTWPFYVQVMGDAVVRAVQGGDDRPLEDPAALEHICVRALLDGWTGHFEARWAEIGAAGRAALLREPGRAPADATPAQRNDLREAGLLRPGDQWLDDRPFLHWIARNRTSLRDGELRP
ncbi:FtsK/SpoIIIE domain-containing protein [Streptomyces aidingensis]|uniref:DNA segregation ATPase FtsK/SpoIIIE, S-DNA-T family n=1 Tax=Streptomyces aidingensis TaxID=910347 RepID=A0A1I1SLD6_9ACTN|nr:FtsK/SpoIIIE domain-containing protein [Streptomyces aidingensis]SFD45498.1 DNA segregation ATPase FtsK/SpoIIIE, S-DNA-T family [Streptomyces aidingensis]